MPEAAVPIVGSVVSGVVSNSANKKATKAATQAADKASEIQKYMYDTTREDLAPYRNTGTAANAKLSALMGLGNFDREGLKKEISGKYSHLFDAVNAPAPTEQPTPGIIEASMMQHDPFGLNRVSYGYRGADSGGATPRPLTPIEEMQKKKQMQTQAPQPMNGSAY